ncbi:MAG: hypothetical protein J6A01_08455 [Proteobacteria bacterium]|nr:hypothetical protein [Pseudomonadota bacterium]
MKSFKNLIGTFLSGIGALTGISMLMNACNEDQDNKPLVEVTAAQVQQCCGTDQTAPEYFHCVNRYIYTGTCITSDSLNKCCGSKSEDRDAYTSCVEDYIKNGSCSEGDHEWEAVPAYGMPEEPPPEYNVTPEEIEECCGKDDGSGLYRACADQFDAPNKAIFCIDEDSDPIEDIPPVVYGPAPIACCGDRPETDDSCGHIYQNTGICPEDQGYEGLEECCGGVADYDDLKLCVEDFVKYGLCIDYQDLPEPVYGMPDDPDD